MECSVCGTDKKVRYRVGGKASCSSTKCLSRLYIESIDDMQPGERYNTALALTHLRQEKIRSIRANM